MCEGTVAPKGTVRGGKRGSDEMQMVQCRRCGGEVVQKSRGRLILVGVLMLAAVGLGLVSPLLWVPAVVFAMTGAYLLVWASVGRGRWCRTCKRFDGV